MKEDNWQAFALEIKYIKNKTMTKEVMNQAIRKKLEAIQVLNLVKFKEAGWIAIIAGYAEADNTFYIFTY